MIARYAGLLALLLALFVGTAWSAEGLKLRFVGDESDRTDSFEADGPWLLDWSISGKSRLSCNFALWADADAPGQPCRFEMRLLAADSGEYLGTIAQLEGTGRGLKLFDEPGHYRIEVAAENIAWELRIRSIDEEAAADLVAATESGVPLSVQANMANKQVQASAFRSWRPVDNGTLLLFAEDKTHGFRATFSPPCPGLADATALSFVTSFETSAQRFDSILLDDGTQCYFDRVVPTVFD